MAIRFNGELSVEMAMKNVERNGYALKYIPEAMLTEAIILRVVERNGYALQYVPEAMLTEAIILRAVESDGDALQYVFNKELFIKISTMLNIEVCF